MSSPRRSQRYHPLGTEERHALDQQLQEQRFAALEAERDRVFANRYTFKPKLTTPRPLPTCGNGSDPDDDDDEAPACASHDARNEDEEETLQSAAARQHGSVFARLAAKAAEREARQREREEEHHRKEAQAQRSAFRPQVNHRSKLLVARAMGLDALPVQERLLQYGRSVATSHEAQRLATQEREAAALAQAQHRGSRHDEGRFERSLSKQAFDARNAALLQQREYRQAQAAVPEPDAFKPRISSTSALLDEKRRRRARLTLADESQLAYGDDCEGMSDPTADRAAWLYAEAQRSQQLKELAREASLQREEREVFRGRTPQTNPISDTWIAQGEHQRLFACDFVTRQELYRRAQETERQLQAQAESDAKLAASLSHSPGKVSAQEVDEQVSRLYDRARERSQQQRRRLAEKVRADENCTFAPQLSPGTKHVIRQMRSEREVDVVKRLTQDAVGTSPARDGHAETPRSQKSLSASRPSARASQSPSPRRAHATLRDEADGAPPPPHNDTASSASRAVSTAEADIFYRRQLAQVSRKEYKLAMLRKEKATEDVMQCTFRPKTNADQFYEERAAQGGDERGVSRAPQTQPISGVKAFLQRQAEAKRLREEKEARELNLGRGRPLSPHHRTTRFQPFRLTADLRMKRIGSESTRSRTASQERRRDTTTHDEKTASASASAAVTPSGGRPFLSNLSTNGATRPMSLPPKRRTAPTETVRSRSALRLGAGEDRKNLSVSFADSSDEVNEAGSHTAQRQGDQHSDPYDIQALMERLRRE